MTQGRSPDTGSTHTAELAAGIVGLRVTVVFNLPWTGSKLCNTLLKALPAMKQNQHEKDASESCNDQNSTEAS